MVDRNYLNECLITGSNYVTKTGIEIINYKLGEIYKGLGYDTFMKMLQIVALDTDSENLKKLGIVYTISSTQGIREMLIGFLSIITTEEEWFFTAVGGLVNSLDKECQKRIYDDDLLEIFEVCKSMYLLKEKKEEAKATTKEGEDLLKEFAMEEKRIRDLQGKSNSLNGIIFSICSRDVNYNLFNIWNLTLYQLIGTYKHICNFDKYSYHMMSVFNGKMESKELKGIDWSEEIAII